MKENTIAFIIPIHPPKFEFIYNLTKKIANNFIDYLIFRPEMIANWHKYDFNSQKLFNNLNPTCAKFLLPLVQLQ